MNPTKFLFLCSGNACRSVMADKLLSKAVLEKRLKWQVRSAGVSANRNIQVPSGTRKALASFGVTQFHHVAQPLSRDLLRWADLTLAMCDEHVDAAKALAPECAGKIALLREHVGLPQTNIEDPMGVDDDYMLECCRLINEGVEALLKKYAPSQIARP